MRISKTNSSSQLGGPVSYGYGCSINIVECHAAVLYEDLLVLRSS